MNNLELDFPPNSADHNNPESLIQVEYEKFLKLFLELHNCVNDPSTRETKAPEKMELAHRLALEQLKKRPDNQWTIKNEQLIHQETGIKTHNVVITIGDPNTGPNTVLMVHHDVIFVRGTDEHPGKNPDGTIPIQTDPDGSMHGRTIQDNTVHLAATIYNLSKFITPEGGALTFVISDHEENGCLGSHAYKQILAQLLPKDQAIALIALESVQSKGLENAVQIGVGHRGKLDSQVTGAVATSPGQTFTQFYEALFTTEHATYAGEETLLGHTTGTSTYGIIDFPKGLQAKIDVRTNEKIGPADVLENLRANLDNPTQFNYNVLLEQAQKQLEQGIINYTLTNGELKISSNSKISHPSIFNPTKDETVLPSLYIIIKALELLTKETAIDQTITSLSWGNEKQQNSNPVSAIITGTFTITQNQLQEAIQKILNHEIDEQQIHEQAALQKSRLQINEQATVTTGAVISPQDEVIDTILQAMKAEARTLSFMTDIGAPYNFMKATHKDLYSMIFGVGDPSNLHHQEHLSKAEILWLMQALPQLINVTQKTLTAKQFFPS